MAGREEPVAARDTNGVANGNAAPAAGEPVGTGNGNSVAEPGYGEPAPRRRGGLAGLFGRR
jgi:hypothetical protein